MDKRIYLDHAATTYVRQEVMEEMIPYMTELFGNASTLYYYGRESKKALDIARERVAKAIGVEIDSIYFTGSGTEADNWAIKGTAFANIEKGNHIITTNIEHHAVLHTCQYLEKHGFKVTYLPVDKYGLVTPEQVADAMTEETILVSIMFANNEIGTIQPISEIGKVVKDKGVLFHTDAVQAIGNVPIDIKQLNVDLLSLSAHKFYGPKGVGALYIGKGVKIDSFIHGGAQERKRRASTENIAGIVGMGKAIEIAVENMDGKINHLNLLRRRLTDGILSNIDNVVFNGHSEKRLPGNVNVCMEFVEGESLLLGLDMKGIAVSSGSACTSGALDPSHVLLAIGLTHEIAHGSLRLTIGHENTEQEIDYVISELIKTVDRLREMSPLFAQKKGEIKYV